MWQNAGYGIVLGFGLLLTALVLALLRIDGRGRKGDVTSEFFNTAGRSVKTGLTAAVICAQWTWTRDLTDSPTAAWLWGVSGSFWHAAGATIQLLLFSVVAVELKRKARNAHTVCEIVEARWGRAPHLTFLFFCLLTNLISTACILLSGATILNQLTGMNVWLCCFLLPWMTVIYLTFGGLRAKFFADYIYVVVMFIILIIFIWTVWVKTLGTDLIWNGLATVAGYTSDQCRTIFANPPISFWVAGQYACGAIAGNNNGSYTTMLSSSGTIYGILQIFSNFGAVFVDQAYWQSAIAAQPQSGGRGIFWGAMSWFTIPFALGSALGLAAAGLQLPINATEANAGLVAPAIAYHLLGSSGLVLFGIMTFLAVTSGISGEILSISSLFTYDIYKTYWRPNASGKELLVVSRWAVAIYGLGIAGALACIINAFGITAGWLYLLMGVVVSSSVFPLWNLLVWKDANGPGAVAAAWLGTAMAIGTWLLVAAGKYGQVTIASLGSTEAMLAGNIMALLSGGLIHTWLSWMAPQNFDFRSLNNIQLLEDDQSGLNPADYEESALTNHLLWAARYAAFFVITLLILWPVWSLPAVVFDQSYFSWWIFISIAWSFAAAFFIAYQPLDEYVVYRDVVAPFLFTTTNLVFFAPDDKQDDEFEVTIGERDNEVGDIGCVIGIEDNLEMKVPPRNPVGSARSNSCDLFSCFCPGYAAAIAAKP